MKFSEFEGLTKNNKRKVDCWSSKNKDKLVIATPKTFFKNGYKVDIFNKDELVDVISSSKDELFTYDCSKFKPNSCVKIVIHKN